MERLYPPNHNPDKHHPIIWCSSIEDLKNSTNEIGRITQEWSNYELGAMNLSRFFLQPLEADQKRSTDENKPYISPGIVNVQIPQVFHQTEKYDPKKRTITVMDQTGEIEIGLPNLPTLTALNIDRAKNGLPFVGSRTITTNSWKGDIKFYYQNLKSLGLRTTLTYLRENQILSRNKEKVIFTATVPHGA